MNTRGYLIATTLTAVGAVALAVPSAIAATHGTAHVPHVATSPVLGTAHHFTRGLGSARPEVVDFGGDPTSFVTNIHWAKWGGAVATGTGIACRPPANGPIAACRPTKATVKVFGLGRCGAHAGSAYTRVEWWFPIDGPFNPSDNAAFNTCTADLA